MATDVTLTFTPVLEAVPEPGVPVLLMWEDGMILEIAGAKHGVDPDNTKGWITMDGYGLQPDEMARMRWTHIPGHPTKAYDHEHPEVWEQHYATRNEVKSMREEWNDS